MRLYPPRRFAPGTLQVSPVAIEALLRNEADLTLLLWRHLVGDYGEMPYDDRVVNENSIKAGGRVFSIYPLADKTVLWIETEAGWQTTRVFVQKER
jgi:hypothetical protein